MPISTASPTPPDTTPTSTSECRTKHNIYTSALSGSYQLTGKFFSAAEGISPSTIIPARRSARKNFSGNLFINYNYSPKLVVGVGGTAGYNTVQNSSPDQTYEQVNARLSYIATGKVSFSGTGGGEFRQFGSNGSQHIFFTGLHAQRASTSRLTGPRSASAAPGTRPIRLRSPARITLPPTSISVSASGSCRRASLGVAVGYENANYFSTISGFTATRNDDYYYVEPSVDVNVTRYWSVGAYYLHRQDASSFSFLQLL